MCVFSIPLGCTFLSYISGIMVFHCRREKKKVRENVQPKSVTTQVCNQIYIPYDPENLKYKVAQK